MPMSCGLTSPSDVQKGANMDMTQQRQRIRQKRIIVQAVLLALTAIVIWGAVSSARTNLAELGLSSGFGFLERSTGWSYSFSLIERSIDDTYARTLTIGIMNTVFLGLISILLSTVLGFAIGTARDARGLGVNAAATVFVQVFRNIPLILQLVFWYAVLIHLPGPRQAITVFDVAFLSNRGLMIPALNLSLTAGALVLAAAVAMPFLMRWFTAWSASQRLKAWAVTVPVLLLLATVATRPEGAPLVTAPELQGLRFVGGTTVSIELVAMILGIVLYGSAYIAEVVRGGLQEVPKGLVEAGKAVGLNNKDIWFRIKLPMALRTIIPPLGNQWIFIMKATTIGVAIGFSDLFMLISTSITQSGQTLELIGILMAVFLGINYSIAQLVNWLNARLQLKAH